MRYILLLLVFIVTGTVMMACNDEGTDGDGDADNDADGDTDEGCLPEREICNGIDDDLDGRIDEDLWCPVHPLPVADDLSGIWFSPDGEMFVAGGSSVLRWTGSSWIIDDVGLTMVNDVWGTSDTDVWVAGMLFESSVIHPSLSHWNGRCWSIVRPGIDGVGVIYALWGASPSDIWLAANVEDVGVILRWDGLAWINEYHELNITPHALWGVDNENVWAAGYRTGGDDEGVVLHRVGGTWSIVHTVPGGEFHGIWGTGSDDVWVFGDTVLHWDGTQWLDVSVPSRNTLFAGWGQSSIDVWAVGNRGVMLHWDGDLWTDLSPGTTDGECHGINDRLCEGGLFDLAGAPGGRIWAVGSNGTVLEFRDAEWNHILPTVSEFATDLNDVWAFSSEDVWAVGARGTIVHWDGVTWESVDPPSVSDFYSVWGSGPDDVWVVAGDSVGRWDGSAWSDVSAGLESFYGYISDISGVSSDRVWAVDGEVVLQWDGSAWSEVLHPSFGPEAVSAAGADDVWIVGWKGMSAHWDGSAWTEISTGTGAHFGAVHVLPDGVAWAVGSAGLTVVRWDGSAWLLIELVEGMDPNRDTIWASGSDNVWITSEFGGSMYNWNGSSWREAKMIGRIRAISGSNAEDIWAVGGGGLITQWQGWE